MCSGAQLEHVLAWVSQWNIHANLRGYQHIPPIFLLYLLINKKSTESVKPKNLRKKSFNLYMRVAEEFSKYEMPTYKSTLI